MGEATEAQSPKLLPKPSHRNDVALTIPLDSDIDNRRLTNFVNWVAKQPSSNQEVNNQLDSFNESRDSIDKLDSALHKDYYRREVSRHFMTTLTEAIRVFNHNFMLDSDRYDTIQGHDERNKVRDFVLDELERGNFECADIVLRYYREWCRNKLSKFTNSAERRAEYDKLRKIIDIDRVLYDERFEPHDISRELTLADDQMAKQYSDSARIADTLIRSLFELAPGGKKFLIYTYHSDPKDLEDREGWDSWLRSDKGKKIRKNLEETAQQEGYESVFGHSLNFSLPKTYSIEELISMGLRGYSWRELIKKIAPSKVDEIFTAKKSLQD